VACDPRVVLDVAEHIDRLAQEHLSDPCPWWGRDPVRPTGAPPRTGPAHPGLTGSPWIRPGQLCVV